MAMAAAGATPADITDGAAELMSEERLAGFEQALADVIPTTRIDTRELSLLPTDQTRMERLAKNMQRVLTSEAIPADAAAQDAAPVNGGAAWTELATNLRRVQDRASEMKKRAAASQRADIAAAAESTTQSATARHRPVSGEPESTRLERGTGEERARRAQTQPHAH